MAETDIQLAMLSINRCSIVDLWQRSHNWKSVQKESDGTWSFRDAKILEI